MIASEKMSAKAIKKSLNNSFSSSEATFSIADSNALDIETFNEGEEGEELGKWRLSHTFELPYLWF